MSTARQGGGSTDDLDQRVLVDVYQTSRRGLLDVVPVEHLNPERDEDALRFAAGEQPYVARVNAVAGLVAAVVALLFVLVAIVRSP